MSSIYYLYPVLRKVITERSLRLVIPKKPSLQSNYLHNLNSYLISTHLSCSIACLILALRFLTTGRPLTVAALKVDPELGCPVSLPVNTAHYIIFIINRV